jgi:hypothetical protein
LRKLVRSAYFDSQVFAACTYARLLADTDYARTIEAIGTGVGQLAMT